MVLSSVEPRAHGQLRPRCQRWPPIGGSRARAVCQARGLRAHPELSWRRGHMSPVVLAALVKARLWPPAFALAAAHNLPNELERADAMARFAELLAGSEDDEHSRLSANECVSILERIVSRLQGHESESICASCVRVASSGSGRSSPSRPSWPQRQRLCLTPRPRSQPGPSSIWRRRGCRRRSCGSGLSLWGDPELFVDVSSVCGAAGAIPSVERARLDRPAFLPRHGRHARCLRAK